MLVGHNFVRIVTARFSIFSFLRLTTGCGKKKKRFKTLFSENSMLGTEIEFWTSFGGGGLRRISPPKKLYSPPNFFKFFLVLKGQGRGKARLF